MFGRRADGKKVKGLDGLTKMMPMFMKYRTDSVNFFRCPFSASKIDEFIEAKKADGYGFTYRDIMMAAMVRTFALFPKCNRFVMGGRIYQRKHIDVCLSMHKNLRTGDDETVAKMRYSGKETVFEIKKQIDEVILKTLKEDNGTDKVSDRLSKLPLWMMKIAMGSL
ncbi:MAG: hypothetical protein FWG51_01175, partial [Firmicutes bacterium]|nr:hypothetical protein [Bacillota bacterium]